MKLGANNIDQPYLDFIKNSVMMSAMYLKCSVIQMSCIQCTDSRYSFSTPHSTFKLQGSVFPGSQVGRMQWE